MLRTAVKYVLSPISLNAHFCLWQGRAVVLSCEEILIQIWLSAFPKKKKKRSLYWESIIQVRRCGLWAECWRVSSQLLCCVALGRVFSWAQAAFSSLVNRGGVFLLQPVHSRICQGRLSHPWLVLTLAVGCHSHCWCKPAALSSHKWTKTLGLNVHWFSYQCLDPGACSALLGCTWVCDFSRCSAT